MPPVKDLLKLVLITIRALHYNAGGMRKRNPATRHKQQTHPHGWVWHEPCEQWLAGLGCRPDAPRTQLFFRRLTVLDPRNRLQVRVEAAARVPLREADRIAEGRAFAAVSAFCHERVPPQA